MTATIQASKQAICNALLKFINQRSGIEYANYQSGDWKATRECFLGDYRPILKHGVHARRMLRYVELSGITAEALIEASRAYSGRLLFIVREDGFVGVDYTTGQYFPTEYRNAACAVLAQAIWDYWRAGKGFCGTDGAESIRKQARREFGRAIAAKWFS